MGWGGLWLAEALSNQGRDQVKIEIIKKVIPSARQAGITRRTSGGARWTRLGKVYYVVVENGLVEHGPFTRKRDAQKFAKEIQEAKEAK